MSCLSGALGGVCIGLAATILLLLNGKIAGVSGIAFGSLNDARRDRAWRLAFIAGLLLAGGLCFRWLPGSFTSRTHFPAVNLVVAGILVGYGTSMARGCTSGHGVCGLGRLSVRSLAAVAVFTGTAIFTTTLLRHGFS